MPYREGEGCCPLDSHRSQNPWPYKRERGARERERVMAEEEAVGVIRSLEDEEIRQKEEGEIEDEDAASADEDRLSSGGGGGAIGAAPLAQVHPLENSWTFWFDNPSAKSKQAAWGSSIRPIHTFATVEDFWR